MPDVTADGIAAAYEAATNFQDNTNNPSGNAGPGQQPGITGPATNSQGNQTGGQAGNQNQQAQSLQQSGNQNQHAQGQQAQGQQGQQQTQMGGLIGGIINESQQEQQEQQAQQEQQGQPDIDNTPLSDWSSFKDYGVDAALLNQSMLDSFGKGPATQTGLTPNQARALLQWHTDYLATQQREAHARGMEDLKKTWGANADANCKKINEFCSNIDKTLPGFSEAITVSGAGLNPTVVKGLFIIAQRLGEDSAGMLQPTGNKPETPMEGIRNAFARARAGLK